MLDRRNYWIDNAAKATLRLARSEHRPAPPAADDLIRLAVALTPEQTSQVDNARRILQASVEEILLAALARTIAVTVGDGVAAVDLAGAGRSVLRPEVDLRRTVGWFSTIYPIALPCMDLRGCQRGSAARGGQPDRRGGASPRDRVRTAASSARPDLSAAGGRPAPPDVFVSYLGMMPEWQESDAPVQFDGDTELAVGRPCQDWVIRSSCGRFGRAACFTWTGGTTVGGCRAAPPRRSRQQFPATLIALIDEAVAGDDDGADSDAEDEALALVDLSAAIFDDDE